jgi:hypothetical protein
MRPGIVDFPAVVDWAWYEGMHHSDETPPPPAPLGSFQTLSELEPMEVPPTAMTFGWLAGSSTVGASPSLVPASR